MNEKLDTKLIELIAEKIHEKWMQKRIEEGWTFGPERNDTKKQNPCLIPYHDLPDSEKEYDRASARETLDALHDLGFQVIKRSDKHSKL